jgi:hypothetical protein
MLARLSPQMQITSVLSGSPISSIASITRPMFQSVFSEYPAYTSIWRAYRRFWFSVRESQAGIWSGRGVSCAPAGITPSRFCLSKVSSRSLSQP